MFVSELFVGSHKEEERRGGERGSGSAINYRCGSDVVFARCVLRALRVSKQKNSCHGKN